MRHSASGLVSTLLIGCSGFDSPKLVAAPAADAPAGIAGYAFASAGVSQAGRSASSSRPGTGGSAPSWTIEGEGGLPAAEPDGSGGADPGGGGGAGEDAGTPAATERAGASHGGSTGRAGASAAGASGGGASSAGIGGRAAAGGHGGAGGAGAGGAAGRVTSGSGGAVARSGAGGLSGSEGGEVAIGGAGATAVPSRPLLFSEYVEGTSTNKALEIRALSATELTGCSVVVHFNTGTTKTYELAGSLGANEVYVLCSSSLAAVLGPTCDLTVGISFNGDDAIALECDGAPIDVIGQIGEDPGVAWGNVGHRTQDQTLRRRCEVTTGDPDGSDAFDPAAEWLALPVDTYDGLGDPTCG